VSRIDWPIPTFDRSGIEGTFVSSSAATARKPWMPGPGDFLHIPKNVVHREVNSGSTGSQEIITRSGTGPPTINVDGPAPPSR